MKRPRWRCTAVWRNGTSRKRAHFELETDASEEQLNTLIRLTER